MCSLKDRDMIINLETTKILALQTTSILYSSSSFLAKQIKMQVTDKTALANLYRLGLLSLYKKCTRDSQEGFYQEE